MEDQFCIMLAKNCTRKRSSFCCTLNTSYCSSFIKQLMLVIHERSLALPKWNVDFILHAHTTVLLSCSLIHDCILRVCLNVYVWAGCTHFGQALTESTSGNFYVCPRKQVRSWIHTLQLATYWIDAKKTFSSLSKTWVRKMKIWEN